MKRYKITLSTNVINSQMSVLSLPWETALKHKPSSKQIVGQLCKTENLQIKIPNVYKTGGTRENFRKSCHFENRQNINLANIIIKLRSSD